MSGSLEFNTQGLYEKIFDKEVLDTATEQRKVVIFENTQSRSLDASSSQNWMISADCKNKMVFLSEAYLELKLTVAPAGDTTVAKLRYSLFSFFKRISLSIQGARIEDISDAQIVSAVRALTENCLTYNSTVLSSTGFSVDQTATERLLTPVDNSRLMIPLGALFLSVKHIPLLYGCMIDISGTRNSFNDIISSNDQAASGTASTVTDVFFSDIRMHCPVYQPTPSVRTMIESRLLNTGFEREFWYEHGYVHKSAKITAADPQISFTVAEGLPSRIYVVPVPSNKEGTATADRVTFLCGSADSYLKNINLIVDNTRLLERDITNDFRADCQDLYRVYIDHLRKQDSALGAPLSLAEFRSTYQIVCFDLQHQPQTLFQTGRTHDIQFSATSVHGNTAGTADYSLYCVVILKSKAKLVGSAGAIYISK